MFVDSHAHIDGEEFAAELEEVLARARAAGVRAILTVGTGDPHAPAFARAGDVAAAHEEVYAAFGVHPHDARLYDESAEERLRWLLSGGPKVVALGEIGLDYYYDHSPRDVQRRVLIRQLELARELRLPVIIHSREADDETIAILREHWADPPRPGVMHCFGGSPGMAGELLAEGFFISFAGNVTFKKAENLREAARLVPLDRLLIETDCPYLAPVPVRGRRNEPAYVVHTAHFLAALKDVTPAELGRATAENFSRAFGVRMGDLGAKSSA